MRWTMTPLAAVAALWIAAAASPAAGQEACTDCHDVDPEAVAASVHGFLDCTDCHAGAAELPHADDVAAPACGDCHPDVLEQFLASAHGEGRTAGDGTWLAGCVGCHGEPHTLLASEDPASPVYPQRLAETCGHCHSDPEMADRFRLGVVRPVEAYLQSVHARALAAGDNGANCASCHGSHAVFPASDPRSSVNHQKVVETCGTCHGDIAAEFSQSVHGEAAALGVREAPVCTDCHGEHRILSPTDEDSPVFATNIPKMTCGRCHGDVRLNTKFGISPDRVPSFEDSFHGLAMRAGGATVAHCASCHGVHDILPSSDPRSKVSKQNLAATCGQCHPGAGTRFTIGTVHISAQERENAAVYWIRQFYLWLIWLTVGAMALHNGLDLYRKARRPWTWRPATHGPSGPVRMLPGFRIAHGLLALSFMVLVYTGFALKYPEGWWAQPLLAWEAGYGLRGWLHRVAAVVLLATAGFHVVHLAVNRRARACIGEMVRPRLADWHELKERVAYLLGRREHPPQAAWVGYPEKMEYLALIWGTVLMAVTGFLLWFENLVLAWMPKWVTDVATVIHFYEGVLASLAILVWHFYFVIFDPLVYPMDTAWWTGRSVPGRAQEREAPPAS